MKTLPLLLVYCCALLAQSNEGVISGTVRNATTGFPIQGLHVSLIGESTPEVQTGAGGDFRFASLPEGTYSLHVEAPGYTGTKPLKVATGADSVTISLYPLARIEGRVVDEDGAAMDGAVVSVWFPDPANLTHAMRTATADRDGRFALGDLPPMDYQLHILIPQAARHSRYPAVEYYPGVADPRQAVSIHLAEGSQMAGFEVRLHPVPLSTLRGRIVDLDRGGGAPPVEVALDTEPANVPGRYVRHTIEKDGRFRFDGVPPGAHRLQIYRGAGGEELPYAATVTATDDEVVVRVPSWVALRGKVRSTVKTPWDGVLGIGLGMQGAWRRIVVPDEEGNFSLPDVPPGEYTLRIESNNLTAEGRPLRIASARFGHANVLGKPMTVAESGNPPIEILLSDESGGIAGAVEGDSRGTVVVTAQNLDDIPASQDNFAETGPDGSFLFSGLLPGTYRVVAWSLGASRQSVSGTPCADASATVSVSNGRTATVRLKRCVQ